MKLCTCLQCGNVFEDMNPGDASTDYPNSMIEQFNIPELPTIKLDDGDIGYGCPDCETDGNLSDNLNPFAGGRAAEIARELKLQED